MSSPADQAAAERIYFFFRPRVRSTRFRLLPTFLTAFVTAEADFRVFFPSYRTS
jgi:hypothetical protein